MKAYVHAKQVQVIWNTRDKPGKNNHWDRHNYKH